MEVASYLCPVAFAGAFSFSPIFWRAPGFRIGEGGRAESLARHLPALAGLPCPLAQLRKRFKNRAGLEGILLHPATVGGSGGARRRLCGPLRAKIQAAESPFAQTRILARTRVSSTQTCPLQMQNWRSKTDPNAHPKCSQTLARKQGKSMRAE